MANVKETIARVVDLRNKKAKQVPDGVGFYKWYATKEDLLILLNKLELKFENIPEEQWDIENGLYCIYVGIAKKSLRNRIVDWHINQHHQLSAIKSGHLSTLRQSLSSVLFINQANENGTNDFLDRLVVHYFCFEDLNPCFKASGELIEKIETGLINDGYLKILNGAKNKSAYKSKILTKLRSVGKENGIKSLSESEINN